VAAPLSGDNPGLDYLALLRTELIEHVRRARGALDRAAPGAALARGTAVCVDAIQQVQGVLRTLGLERLTLLAEALAKVARDLGALSAERQEEVVGILRDGLDQLRDGIEHRAAHRPELVWTLVAALNELRASLALPLVSEACLFAPQLEQEFAGLQAVSGAVAHDLQEAARSERTVLHRGLYLWYSGREPERGLRKLRRVAESLGQFAETERLQRFFLILEGVFVAFAEGSIVPGGAIRRVLAGVDQLLKRVGEVGEQAVATTLPVDLVRNLLFFVAVSGSPHRILRAVRDGSDLRLVTATGCDGRDRAAALLVVEVERLRHRVAQADRSGLTAASSADLAAAVLRLSDGLALAELADQRRQLADSLEALQRAGGGAGAVREPLPELDEALGRIDKTLRAFALGGAAVELEPPVPASEVEVAAAQMAVVEEEVTAADQELEGLSSASGDATSAGRPPELKPLDDDIREVFLEEAAEKVEAMRHQYVTWSAQRDDGAALASVLAALDSLKSTGRLVGADTLSEVCWVLEAALGACRDGTLTASDEALAVLDAGIEMVDALVGAHVAGRTVEGDPRLVEQRIYDLLTPVASASPARAVPRAAASRSAGPAQFSGSALADAAMEQVPEEADALGGDLDLVELFAEEAGDLADALEEGLHGLEQDPARSAWLMEMRRALRALAAAARHAELPQLNALCEAFDGFLARAAAAGTGVGPDALSLTREATGTVAGVVEALRNRGLPHLPANLIDRLRDAGARPAPRAAPRAPEAAAPTMPATTSELASTPDPALAQRVIERASGAGVCHLQLEAQVAVLREQVGRLEGVLALLRRLPATEALPPRAAAVLVDLGGCADRLHETILTISAQLRAQGHHLTGLQQGLAVAFADAAGPSFADLLLVGIADGVYAIPAATIDSVRRLAPDLIPPDGGRLELRGRAFVYRHLGDLLAIRRDAAADSEKSRSVVLARVGERAVALGVDSVVGHRTLLVAGPPAGGDNPSWLGGLAPLGGGRDAPVVDLDRLLARA
jgi:chemosensory pili system protein ChpA (sensor histidine kinase/response regulator)